MNDKVTEAAAQIKLLISDVDGVLTDGAVYIGSSGDEFKKFTVEDGAGAAFAKLAGLPVAFISGRYSEATSRRAKELKIVHCIQGKLDKITAFEELCKIYDVERSEVAYIGDGLVDIPVMEKAGLPISVPNAHKLVKEKSFFITKLKGGNGAFREVVEIILEARGLFAKTMKQMRQNTYIA